MKKILSFIIITTAILFIVYLKYHNDNINKIKKSSILDISLCGNIYKIDNTNLDSANTLSKISEIINYNYEHDNSIKPSGNATDNPTEYIKYNMRPFVIASTTCSMLSKSYNNEQLNIHDIKNTDNNISFYVDKVKFYYYNNTNSISVDIYPDDQSGMNGPYKLEIK